MSNELYFNKAGRKMYIFYIQVQCWYMFCKFSSSLLLAFSFPWPSFKRGKNLTLIKCDLLPLGHTKKYLWNSKSLRFYHVYFLVVLAFTFMYMICFYLIFSMVTVEVQLFEYGYINIQAQLLKNYSALSCLVTFNLSQLLLSFVRHV